MTREIVIRPATQRDRDFVVGLVPSLLEFGSPAWRDPGALRPGLPRCSSARWATTTAWARDRGFDLLSLDVWSTNDAALAFYRHAGYTIDSLSLIKRI
jgi:GNAT superfamily N-acetyltransferase